MRNESVSAGYRRYGLDWVLVKVASKIEVLNHKRLQGPYDIHEEMKQHVLCEDLRPQGIRLSDDEASIEDTNASRPLIVANWAC